MDGLLNLSGFHVLSQKKHENHLEITVENRFKPQACPHCRYSQLYSHDKTEQVFFDTPVQGKPVILKIMRIRYKCRSCGKTFREPLHDIDDKRLMTSRLKEHIQKRAMRETFAVVARETGLDEKTIRHVFDDYANDKAQTMPFITPRILGIDELKLIGSYRCILTNIEHNTVFNMLPSRKKESLREYLKKLPDKDNIEQVTMDIWQPYKDTVNAELPGRIIAIDKLHIVRMANDSLEASRKATRASLERKDKLKLKNERFVLLKRRHSLSDEEIEKLQQWSVLFPELGLAYNAKEAFYCLFDQGLDSKAAKQALIDWQKSLPPQIAHYFDALTTALSNWMPEILNGFDYATTNAYTESINRYAKDVQRMGRGYSFDVVRAKILYNTEANKPTTSTARKKKRYLKERRYYGAHIPTLCNLLEQGKFD